MNTWQIAKQIRYMLLSRNWTGGSNRVFGRGSVINSAAIPLSMKKHMRVPIALVYPGEGSSDPDQNESPDLLSQMFTVTVITAQPGDFGSGEKPLVGGNVGDRTKSEGRGVLEVEEEVNLAIQRVTTDTGIAIQLASSSRPRPDLDPDLGYVVTRDYVYKAWCITERFYHPCVNFTATGGAGLVTLAWKNPPDRYDRFRVVLRRASGGTAPSTVSAGTGVTLSGNLATSVTDSGLSAGTYSYSLFAQYDETNDAGNGDTLSSADRTSDRISRQAVTVT